MKAVIFILALLLASSLADNPGLGIGVRQQALDNFKNAFFPMVVRQIQNIKIPDQNSGHLKIYDIHLTNFNLPVSQARAILQNGQIELQANHFSVGVSAHAAKKVLFAWIKDKVGITTTDTSIRMTLQIGYSGGHLVFGVPSVTVDIRNLKFHLGGFLGHIVAAFINLFSKPIAHHLNGKIADMLKTETIKSLNLIAQNTHTQFPISNLPIMVSYAPTQTPALTSAYGAFGIDGTFFPKPSYKKPPFPNSKVTPIFNPQEANDIQLFISEYMMNSGLWALTVTGMFNRNFTAASLPANSPYQFTSTSLFPENVQAKPAAHVATATNLLRGRLWDDVNSPQIPEATMLLAEQQVPLPPNVPIEFDCYVGAKNLPHVTLTEGRFGINAGGTCDVYAKITGMRTFILRLDGGLYTALNVLSSGPANSIYFSLLDLKIDTLSIPKSLIGPVNLDGLKNKLNAIIKVALPYLSTELQKHKIPLPQIPHAVISNFKIAVKNGYMEISAHPSFTPF